MHRSAIVLAVIATLVAAACGSSGRPDFEHEGTDGGDQAATSGAASASGGTPAIPPSEGGVLAEPGKTTLRGVTYAPNGTLPLSGVLVYETDALPAAIPEHAYCDTCRVLPEGTFVLSNADGTFELKAHAGSRYLVTEKGQFRRVRPIQVGPDGTVQEVAHELTTLPGSTAEHDTIARIALMDEQTAGDNDAIQQVLVALGISEWTSFHDDLGQVNPENLANFHVALFPCDGSSLNKPHSAERDALRSFVQAGGKVYASDWSHQFVDEPFDMFFEHPNRVWNADTGAQAPAGRFDDPGLTDWLAHVSPNEDPASTHFEGVWSTYLGVHEATVPDATGAAHVVSPHAYAEVTEDNGLYYSKEAATSLEYGCGRALLSTFHVHGGTSSNLLMQEKALLYMLLDVSTCIGTPGRGAVN